MNSSLGSSQSYPWQEISTDTRTIRQTHKISRTQIEISNLINYFDGCMYMLGKKFQQWEKRYGAEDNRKTSTILPHGQSVISEPTDTGVSPAARSQPEKQTEPVELDPFSELERTETNLQTFFRSRLKVAVSFRDFVFFSFVVGHHKGCFAAAPCPVHTENREHPFHR